MAGHGSPPPENKANHPGRQVGRSADPRSQASIDTHARLEASFAARKAAGNYRDYMDDDAIEEGRRLNREGYD